MASQRHKNCNIQDIAITSKNKVSPAVNVTFSVLNNRTPARKVTIKTPSTTSMKSVAFMEKKPVTSKLPLPIGRKIQNAKAVSSNGLLVKGKITFQKSTINFII